MILIDKQLEVTYRKGDILINPYIRSISGDMEAPSEEGRPLRWIIPLIVMFVIAVIGIIVKI